MKKIGICGTNSSGKTTLTYEILWKLKKLGVICDGVLKQDRRLGFNPISYNQFTLDIEKVAHHSLICNQIKAEADMSLRPGLEMLISDRTPLDYLAYYNATFSMSESLTKYVFDWLATFHKIYVLRPVAFEYDLGRPSKDLRDRMFTQLMQLIAIYNGLNIVLESEDKVTAKIWRKQIPSEIIAMSGKSSKLAKGVLSIIAYKLECNVLIGGSYAFGIATTSSDLDIYVMYDSTIARHIEASYFKLKELQLALGGVEIEKHIVPNRQVWDYLKTQGFIEASV
jgi:hypothetical protein